MYQKILIANRADCALRLIRACHDENIEACVICARDDTNRAVLAQADDVVYTGMSRDAYTTPENILEAAHRCDCEAILPGWGFLSEDFSFARQCRHSGIHFIGPKTHQIQLFGDKLKTIQVLSSGQNNHCVLPLGSPEFENQLKTAPDCAWMLKPRFGGGGKGIVSFPSSEALLTRWHQIPSNQRRTYYAEPLIEGGRHIEFQIFGDGMGRIDIMGMRDCTPQVHHQKWLETSVSVDTMPILESLCDDLMRDFSALKYESWGTVEFLIQGDQANLLEVNPRLQVEHGVTEMALNTDIVRRAIRLSCTGTTGFERVPISAFHAPSGNAAEFRLYARTTGTIKSIGFSDMPWPEHPHTADTDYRLETSCQSGDRISGVYDGMLARFIVRDTQNQAKHKLKSWLKTFHIEGIQTNLADLLGIF